MRALPTLLAISLTALGLGACGKGTPVAPTGTKLVVTANPTQIAATGTSTITVTATRSSGSPVNPGTEISLDSTLGTVPSVVTTDTRGVAQATLQGNGVAGTAKVTARSGVADAVSVDVTVGSKVAKITLQPTPTSIDAASTTVVKLLAVVLDDLGQPLPGANVVFGAEAGTLASRGAIVKTNQGGEATDKLTVTPTDAAVAGTDLAINAQVSGGGGSANASTTIGIRVAPTAGFDFTISSLTVTFTDRSIGTPTSWSWDFGDGFTSASQSPIHTYAAVGSYNVTETVSNAFGNDTQTQTVNIH